MTTSDPVSYDKIEIDIDGRTASWTRDGAILGDQGVVSALEAALEHSDGKVTVLRPDVTYTFAVGWPSPTGADITAAMLAISRRGRITPYEAVEQLLDHLGVGDEEEGVIH